MFEPQETGEGMNMGENKITRIIAIQPKRMGNATNCCLLFSNGEVQDIFISIRYYMKRMAASLGNDDKVCRKLFKNKRGTALFLNDGSIYLQVKLRKEVPCLGYILFNDVASVFEDETGKCSIEFASGLTLHTEWTVRTMLQHMENFTSCRNITTPFQACTSSAAEERNSYIFPKRHKELFCF